MEHSKVQHHFPRPSLALSVLIFVISTAAIAYLRLHLFHDRIITLTSALPMLVCLLHRDRTLLWSMAAAFAGISAYKQFVLMPDTDPHDNYELTLFLMQLINILAAGIAVHAILNLTDRLRIKNAELEHANDELAARAEEISRQNEELQAQSEELAQQNEEIQSQSEELAQQNEELQQQSEELQVQTEELQMTNSELNHREAMLQTLLESVRAKGDDRELLERICRTSVELAGQEAIAAAIVERQGDELVVRAHAGFGELKTERWPVPRSFAAVVMECDRTAFVEDLNARPDLVVTEPHGKGCRSILATPLRLNGNVSGVVEVYSTGPHQWTTKQFSIIEWIAAQASLILEVRQLRDEMAAANSRLEQLVGERTAKLRELVEELEHFSYTITHDMRAPLRAMHGFASMLQEECKEFPNDECRDYLQRIITAAGRMDRLITDSLSYSKAVRQEMALAAIDPMKLLAGMIESYPVFQPPRAKIEIVGELPPVLANEAGLTQCFSNLLSNAVKFVSANQTPHIVISGERRDGFVRFWFQDNGIGISPEMHPKIFGMFQRVSKDYEGTGIGLALVRKVTDRMGGRIGVESEPGKGSRFWIELKPVK